MALVSTGRFVYRAAPWFWRQLANERKRNILPPPRRPEWRGWSDRGLHAAWIGHTTVLLKMDGVTVLTDPVLGSRCGIRLGPVTLGLKRLVAPALELSELPAIDLILLSHAHMDHFDIRSLRKLENKGTEVVTARSTSDLLRVGRYRQVREVGWGETVRTGGLSITGLRVNHWGARMRRDTYRGYNGYLIESGDTRVLFAGDTADTREFRAVRTGRPIDLAIVPIGAYDPWIRAHCTPEQALRMADEAGADRLLPVHHQTFRLSREPYFEPIERLVTAAGAADERVAVRGIGEQVSFG
jgi:L-ascorbate metabolism protein UlaG (beta-lactamase superfamily)